MVSSKFEDKMAVVQEKDIKKLRGLSWEEKIKKLNNLYKGD